MSGLFITVLDMSLTASYAAIAVILMRLMLKRAPKIFSYTLWAVVWFRLVCPISFESPLSLMPGRTKTIRYNNIVNSIVISQNPTDSTGVKTIGRAMDSFVQPSLPSLEAVTSANSMDVITKIAAVLWLFGIVVLLGYSVLSYIRLKNRISDATIINENIFETDRIHTPFVLGLIKPRIYVPTGLGSKELDYILKHEQTHIKRRDYIIKPLAFCAVVLHWFNPLMWLSFSLMSKDMEMSCDESVLKQSDEDIRVNYSTSLLSLSAKQSGLLSPLAFGESNVKSRIKNVLNYKKPSFWIVFIAIVLVIVVSIALIANPLDDTGFLNTHGKSFSLAFFNPFGRSEPLSYTEKLFQYKTDYVGDASKVGNIISLLDYPDNIFYDHFELDTDSPPYGVTVHLKTDPETFNNYKSNIKEPPFMQNAIIMFSLIGNVDHVNFNLTDGQKDYLMGYPRNWANAVMGRDVYKFSQSKKEFAQFLEMVEKLPLEEGDSIGIIGGADAPANTKIIARIPDEEIALSAVEREGMYEDFTLEVKGRKGSFDWKNVSNMTYAPELLLSDINHDGQKELVIILTTGTGTGVRMTEAHIINPQTLMEQYIEHPSAIIKNHVKTEITKDQAVIEIDNEKTVVDIGQLGIEPENLFSEVAFNNICRFEVIDNQLRANMGAQISPVGFIGEVQIRYEFKDNRLRAGRIEFIKN